MNIEIVYTQGRFIRGQWIEGNIPDKLAGCKVFDCRLGTPLARSLNDGLMVRMYWHFVFSLYPRVLLLDSTPAGIPSVVDEVISFYSGAVLVPESQGEDHAEEN